MAWYEYPTNYSNGTILSSPGEFIQYANYILNYFFGMGFILLIWVVTFILSIGSGSRKAILTSSFISFIFSIYFVRLGIVPLYIPITLIAMVIIGAIASLSETEGGL